MKLTSREPTPAMIIATRDFCDLRMSAKDVCRAMHDAAPNAPSVNQELLDSLANLCRRAINEANGLTNYVDERPELYGAEKRIKKIEQEFRAAIDAARKG